MAVTKQKPKVGDPVWITKYALTDGVQKGTCTSACIQSDGMIRYSLTMEIEEETGAPYSQAAHGNDWHIDEQSAVARALAMAVRKRISLRKSIRKLDLLGSELRNRLEAIRPNSELCVDD